MSDGWVVFHRDVVDGRDLRTTSTSKEAALSLARDRIRQHPEVERIEGPNEVIDKEVIGRWVADNPG
jgi:hypothetical protein